MTTDIVEPDAPAHVDEGDLYLINDFAIRYNLPPTKVIGILNATAFRLDKQGTVPTKEQTIALIVVCNQYKLNPFTKEIFAFPDKKGVIPVVSVDGWLRIINDRPELDGFEFTYSPAMTTALADMVNPAHEWIECSMSRKDRSKPVIVREYLAECYRPKSATGGYGSPWQSHANRFLRHKALIQAARYAFGFAGIYDADEAQNILRASAEDDDPAMTATLPGPLVEMPTRKTAEAVGASDPALAEHPIAQANAASWATGKTVAAKVDVAMVDQRVEAKSGETKSAVAETKAHAEETKPTPAETLARPGETIDSETGEISKQPIAEIGDEAPPAPAGNQAESAVFPDPPAPAPAPAAAAKPVTAPPPKPVAVPATRIDYLRMRMEFNGVTEEMLANQFTGGIEGIKTMAEFAAIANWVEAYEPK